MSKVRCTLCGVPLSDDSTECKICKAYPPRTFDLVFRSELPRTVDLPELPPVVNRPPMPEAKSSRGAGLKYDAGKLRYSLIPPVALAAIAKVLTFGAEKYAPNSWQTVENAEERYLDALMRHIEAYRDGVHLDSESGISHLSHAACNIAFLLHFEKQRNQ